MNTQTVSAPSAAPMVSASASAAAVHQLLNNLAANNPTGANKLPPRYPPPPQTTTNVLKTNIKPPTTTTSTSNSSLSQAADAAETFRNLSATLNSYTISLQNQLNMAAAAKSAANALSSLAAAPTLVQAASVLSQANTLAQTISLYQHQQHHSVVGLQQLQPPQQPPQASMSSISISNSTSSSSSSSTCNLNNTLFVGNLHASLQEIDLIQVFRPFGRIVECCKKWLHFGFVKFTSEEEACHAYVTLNGFRLKGRPMRLEFQNRTKKAILAQAGLGNGGSAGPASASSSSSSSMQQQQHHNQQGGMSAAAVANAMSGNDLLSMSTAFNNHLNSLSFVNSTVAPSSSSASSTSNSGTSTPATVAALLADSLASSSSSSSSNLNAYLQALTAVAAKSESSSSSSAMMSFFNPDHLIKFASGVESASASSSSHINRNDFGLAALADSSSSASSSSSSSSFEFKLNDELIKDFNLNEKNNSEGDDLVSLLKKASLTSESSSTSPTHDLSSSSDSGCRSSNSFLNDEDSACFSISSTSLAASSAAIVKQQQANKSSLVKVTDFLDAQAKKQHSTDSSQQIALDELTISEHMEFTCSSSVVQRRPESSSSSSGACSSSSSVEDDDSDSRNEENEEEDEANESQNSSSSSSSSDDDSVSECDTSDDASDIPTDTECLNEIDELIEENCFMLQQEQHDELQHKGEVMRSFDLYTQVVDNDGSVARKKLTSGIYKSMNQTLSLFIEPNDVLKPMSADEYNEYVLFPNRICDISLPAPVVVDSSSSASSLLVQIKNPQVFLI